jgi:hypothetical protein
LLEPTLSYDGASSEGQMKVFLRPQAAGGFVLRFKDLVSGEVVAT